MFRRIAPLVAALLGCVVLATPSGAATLPAGANGYRSVVALAEKQKESVVKGTAAPGNLHGVPSSIFSTESTGSGVKTDSLVGWECSGEGWIQSAYNGLYVSTELGYGGGESNMLRARSSSVGPWELYQICWPSSGSHEYAIWSDAASKVVTAEIGPEAVVYGMLRARANSVGAWEKFTIVGSSRIYINGANGLWVSAEFGWSGNWYGMLRARSESIGAWEEYNSSI